MRTIGTEVLERLQAEYLEMPGMRLTVQQVQRLCGVERTTCQWALDSLVSTKFLRLKEDGTYCRLTEGDVPRPLSAKAQLPARPRVAAAS
jgi:DNA-binding IclR family transcriptional regulator